MINIDNHLIAIDKMIKDATLPSRREKAVNLRDVLNRQPLDVEAAVKIAKDLLHGAKASRPALTELINELEAPAMAEQPDLGLDMAHKETDIHGPLEKVDSIAINDRPISEFANNETIEQTLANVIANMLSEAFRNPSGTVTEGMANSIKTPEHDRYNCAGQYIPPRSYMKIEGVGPDQPIIINTQGGRMSDTPYYFNDLDPQAMLLIGERSGHGLKKYGPLNWQKISSQEHLNHALVHIYAYMAGDRSDTIAGGHLSGAGWRIIAALGQALRGR